MTRYSLVADVGGTNTRVALAVGTEIQAETVRKHRNLDHDGLAALLASYVKTQSHPRCDKAAVAIAGPVRDGAGQLTNLNWELDKDTLAQITGAARTAVLNDLQAQGHALGHISATDMTSLKRGTGHTPHAAMLVVGVGTGFNCAPVLQTQKGRLVPPSESGHMSLPSQTDEQRALSQFLRASLGHVAVEDVLSGRGLENCYQWAAHKAGRHETASTSEIFAAAKEQDEVATAAICAFVRTLGGVVGDLALTLLPFGGIYLVGGMARAVTPWCESAGFDAAFTDKGRFKPFLNAFSVVLVEDDFAALTGCAHFLASSDNQ